MDKAKVRKGLKVWYYPEIGGRGRMAEITSDEVFDICGTECTFIDIVTGCVAIDNLDIRENEQE